MKKTIATAVTTAIVTAAISIACFAGCANKSGKQTATAYLDQDGTMVEATVDLSKGYSCDIAKGAVYLYDQENKEGIEPVAMGITLEEDVYNDYVKEAKNDTDAKGIKDGIMYKSDSDMIYITKVSDSAYFGVFAHDATPKQMEKLINRFEVNPGF